MVLWPSQNILKKLLHVPNGLIISMSLRGITDTKGGCKKPIDIGSESVRINDPSSILTSRVESKIIRRSEFLSPEWRQRKSSRQNFGG